MGPWAGETLIEDMPPTPQLPNNLLGQCPHSDTYVQENPSLEHCHMCALCRHGAHVMLRHTPLAAEALPYWCIKLRVTFTYGTPIAHCWPLPCWCTEPPSSETHSWDLHPTGPSMPPPAAATSPALFQVLWWPQASPFLCSSWLTVQVSSLRASPRDG